MKQILLTGSTGFVGKRFLEYNQNRCEIQTVSLQNCDISGIDFKGIDSIVHLAGKAHQMKKIDDQIYFDVNFNLTKKLAEAAKQAGVEHFIFISTIKVFGKTDCEILCEKSVCNPINDAYGQSKFDAAEGDEY